jgi:hypothetical protein
MLVRDRRIIVGRSFWINTGGGYLPPKFLCVIFQKLAFIRCESTALMREAK